MKNTYSKPCIKLIDAGQTDVICTSFTGVVNDIEWEINPWEDLGGSSL